MPHRPPYHPTWEPPSRPQSPSYEADLRERLRALEVSMQHHAQVTADRLSIHVRRMEQHDERSNGQQARLTEAERRTAAIGPLSERVTAIESKLRAAKERIQYTAAAILFGLVAGGKMTVDQLVSVLQAVAKIVGS